MTGHGAAGGSPGQGTSRDLGAALSSATILNERDGIPRELLPCSLPFDPSFFKGGCLTRSVQRRVQRRLAWQAWCNEGVAAINELYGRGPEHEAKGVGFSMAQKHCLELMSNTYRDLGPPPPDTSTPAGAFKELCGSKAGYADVIADLGTPTPFRPGEVSLPPVGSQPAPLEQLLDGRAFQLWEGWRHHLPKPQDEVDSLTDQPVTYTDPALTRRPAHYASFIKDLLERNVISLQEKRDQNVGIFFVSKKDSSLRLIFDTRGINLLFKEPSKTVLPTAGTWGRLETPRGGGFYLAQADVQAAFYRMALPRGMEVLFVLPPVLTSLIPGLSKEKRAALGKECSPCMAPLPMGWAWALFFCQAAVEGGRATERAVTRSRHAGQGPLAGAPRRRDPARRVRRQLCRHLHGQGQGEVRAR